MKYAKWTVACLLLVIGGKLAAAECGPTDGMFDSRDRQRVEASLSVAAVMANDYSAEVRQAANQTLATVGRPGIAVHMAKTRDVVQRSAALFAGCTAPR